MFTDATQTIRRLFKRIDWMPQRQRVAEKRGEICRKIFAVTAEDFIRTLAIEHDGNLVARAAHDLVMRETTGHAHGFVVMHDDLIERREEVAAARRMHVGRGTDRCVHRIHVLFFRIRGLVVHDGERRRLDA